MSRAGGGWVPDGRAKAIRADCEASLEALDGLPIDLYLLHAPDPRTPWRTSVRALARLVDEGLVRRVGVANVNLPAARRGARAGADRRGAGAAQPVRRSRRCAAASSSGARERGIAVIAHSPLGGPRRAGRLARNDALVGVANAHGATPAQVALAWLLVALAGGRRDPGRAPSRDGALGGRERHGSRLTDDERALLARELGEARPERARRRDAEVVLVMGIPGAGKSRVAAEYVARGYERLNRDERGGSLRELAAALDELLAAGARRIVLDNTYLTRASRSYAVDAASRYGASARCVWIDTPLAQAQVNLVERLLERFGSLPDAGGAARRSRARSRARSRRRRRCARSASSSRRPPTRASPTSSTCRSRVSRGRSGRAAACSSRPRR